MLQHPYRLHGRIRSGSRSSLAIAVKSSCSGWHSVSPEDSIGRSTKEAAHSRDAYLPDEPPSDAWKIFCTVPIRYILPIAHLKYH